MGRQVFLPQWVAKLCAKSLKVFFFFSYLFFCDTLRITLRALRLIFFACLCASLRVSLRLPFFYPQMYAIHEKKQPNSIKQKKLRLLFMRHVSLWQMLWIYTPNNQDKFVILTIAIGLYVWISANL